MPWPHVAYDHGLILACANVWAHLAGSDDPELIALANECHEALTRAGWKMVPVQQQAQEMVG